MRVIIYCTLQQIRETEAKSSEEISQRLENARLNPELLTQVSVVIWPTLPSSEPILILVPLQLMVKLPYKRMKIWDFRLSSALHSLLTFYIGQVFYSVLWFSHLDITVYM